MLDWLVCDGKLSKIVAHHFRLFVYRKWGWRKRGGKGILRREKRGGEEFHVYHHLSPP